MCVNRAQVSRKLSKIVHKFTPEGAQSDSILHMVLVLSGKRTDIEVAQIPEAFTPIIGRLKLKCRLFCVYVTQRVADSMAGLLNIFIDDQSYNSGHGHAYDAYGVKPNDGALVVIRPDQCKSQIPDPLRISNFHITNRCLYQTLPKCAVWVKSSSWTPSSQDSWRRLVDYTCRASRNKSIVHEAGNLAACVTIDGH